MNITKTNYSLVCGNWSHLKSNVSTIKNCSKGASTNGVKLKNKESEIKNKTAICKSAWGACRRYEDQTISYIVICLTPSLPTPTPNTTTSSRTTQITTSITNTTIPSTTPPIKTISSRTTQITTSITNTTIPTTTTPITTHSSRTTQMTTAITYTTITSTTTPITTTSSRTTQITTSTTNTTRICKISREKSLFRCCVVRAYAKTFYSAAKCWEQSRAEQRPRFLALVVH